MKLIIQNLTKQQAETLAHWFEGQGEQDCIVWFEEAGVRAPKVDVLRRPWIEKDAYSITIWCA